MSNNIMDYNQWFPHAFTVCQIQTMHNKLTWYEETNEYVHSCNGCMPSQAFFNLRESHCTDAQIIGEPKLWLFAEASFNENKYLIEICEVSSVDDFECDGDYYNSGWQNGQIGRLNLLDIYDFSSPDKFYKIKLIVDNTECPLSDIHEAIIQTRSCIGGPTPGGNGGGGVKDFSITNNPSTNWSEADYELTKDGQITIVVVDNLTNSIVKTVVGNELRGSGTYSDQIDVSDLQPGIYNVFVYFEGEIKHKSLLRI
jgi:hypothetical protein